jgi:hypothetical protein
MNSGKKSMRQQIQHPTGNTTSFCIRLFAGYLFQRPEKSKSDDIGNLEG